MNRQFRVLAPNLLVVADFTYVPMIGGFGYTAFLVDAYAGLIAGWECSLKKDTAFVVRALCHAATYRTRRRRPFDATIHHSDAGSHRNTFRWTLMLAGLVASSGPLRMPTIMRCAR